MGLKFKLSAELLVAFANQPNKQHSTTVSQRNQRNQSHVKPNTSLATNQQQQQQQHQDRPQLSSYLFQLQQQPQPPLLQLKLQCKYKLTEVSDVTFNELLARQVVSQATDSGDTTTISTAASVPTETSLKLGPDEHRKSISFLLEASQISRVSKDRKVNEDDWSRGAKRRRWMEEETRKGNGFVTISKSADNQVTQNKCPATHRELLKALSRLPARSSDACLVGVSPLLLDDPLIVEQTTEPITNSADVEGSSGSITSKAGGLSEVTPEMEAEGEIETNKSEFEEERQYVSGVGRIVARKVASSPAQNNVGDKNLNARQSVVSKGENINLVKSNNNVLRVNCLTLGTLLSNSETFSSNINTEFCIDVLNRRQALISGKHQLYSQASGLNVDFNPASNQRPYSHRLGSNNNSISNMNFNKQGGVLLSYLSLSGLTRSGDTTSDNATTRQVQQAAANLLAKLSNDNGDGHNLGGVTNWPIVADSSRNGDSSLVDGRGSGSGDIREHDRDTEAQHWQLLAPPLLEWFINNQEVSLMLSC